MSNHSSEVTVPPRPLMDRVYEGDIRSYIKHCEHMRIKIPAPIECMLLLKPRLHPEDMDTIGPFIHRVRELFDDAVIMSSRARSRPKIPPHLQAE